MSYLFSGLWRSLWGRPLLGLLGGAVLLGIFLVAAALTRLVWGDPADLRTAELLVPLKASLTQAQTNRLYLQVREWDEVLEVRYALSAEELSPRRSLSVPEGPALLVTLWSSEDVPQVSERLGEAEGVRQVLVIRAGALPELLHRTAGLLPGLLAVLAVLGVAGLLALRAGVHALTRDWRGELEMLRLSGIGGGALRLPFLTMGLLAGVLSAVVAVLALYAGGLWAQGHVELTEAYLPLALDQRMLTELMLAVLLGGLACGALAGSWGARAVRDI